MFVKVTGEKLVWKGVFLPTIMNKVKHDNCIVKLSLMPTSPIILILLLRKISLLEKVFDTTMSVCEKAFFMHCLKTPHCSVPCLE